MNSRLNAAQQAKLDELEAELGRRVLRAILDTDSDHLGTSKIIWLRGLLTAAKSDPIRHQLVDASGDQDAVSMMLRELSEMDDEIRLALMDHQSAISQSGLGRHLAA